MAARADWTKQLTSLYVSGYPSSANIYDTEPSLQLRCAKTIKRGYLYVYSALYAVFDLGLCQSTMLEHTKRSLTKCVEIMKLGIIVSLCFEHIYYRKKIWLKVTDMILTKHKTPSRWKAMEMRRRDILWKEDAGKKKKKGRLNLRVLHIVHKPLSLT